MWWQWRLLASEYQEVRTHWWLRRSLSSPTDHADTLCMDWAASAHAREQRHCTFQNRLEVKTATAHAPTSSTTRDLEVYTFEILRNMLSTKSKRDRVSEPSCPRSLEYSHRGKQNKLEIHLHLCETACLHRSTRVAAACSKHARTFLFLKASLQHSMIGARTPLPYKLSRLSNA